jgi:hypothetical protein
MFFSNLFREKICNFSEFLMFILSGFSSPSSNAKGRTSNPDRRRRWASLARDTQF